MPRIPPPVLFVSSALLDRGAYALLLAVLTGLFGLGADSDVFFVTTTLPMVVATLTGDACFVVLLRTANAPDLGEAERWTRVGQQMTLLVIGYAVAAAAIALAAPLLVTILAPGLAPATAERAVPLLRLAALLVPIHGMGTVFANLLIARNRMAAGALRLPATNLAAAAAVLVAGITAGPDVRFMVGAMVTAGAAVTAVLGVQALALRGEHRFGRVQPPAAGTVRELAGALLMIGASNLVPSLILLIERAVASGMAPGTLAAVALARTFVPLLGTIPGAAASGQFAAALAGGQAGHAPPAGPLARDMVYAAVLTAVPVLAIFLAKADAAIGFLFEHGRFTGADTGLVAALAVAFVGAAPYLVLSTPLTRAMQAMHRDAACAALSVAGFAAYIPLAWWWSRSWEAIGLIGAYAAAMNGLTLVMAVYLVRSCGRVVFALPWARLALCAAAAATAALVPSAMAEPPGHLADLVLAGTAGGAGFLLSGRLLALPGLGGRAPFATKRNQK